MVTRLIVVASLILSTACMKRSVVVQQGSASTGPRVTVSLCDSAVELDCENIHYITQASAAPTAVDARYQLGVYDAFASGAGVALSCDVATDENQCLADTREFLLQACQNEVATSPPIHARLYTNPTSSPIRVMFEGRSLNFTFNEIICQFNQSRIN